MSHIVVENLSKSYRIATRKDGFGGAFKSLFARETRTARALDAVSFSVSQGSIVGYIGPNGAGKSTTIKVLAGILLPDEGSRVNVAGRVPWLDRKRHVAELGVVFGQRTQLWWDLPVRESFDLLRHIYAIELAQYRRTTDELVNLLDITSVLDVPARQLSLGQRMRCDLVASLLHSPRLLFLDEPTIGLDAVSKMRVRQFVKRLSAERGVTVLLTTHDMDDIEALCDRVLILGSGKLLWDDTLKALRKQVGGERHLVVDLVDPEAVFSHHRTTEVAREQGRLRLAFNPSEIDAARLIADVSAKVAVTDLLVENPPIETVIQQLYVLGGGAG